MSKGNKNKYAGVEDYASKKNRGKWAEDEIYEDPREKIEQNALPQKRVKTRKRIFMLVCFIIPILLFLGILILPLTEGREDTPRNQLFKLLKANTDREYNLPGGHKMEGEELWISLGEIDAQKYQSLTGKGQQDFVDDVIAASHKAIAEDAVKIGNKHYNTKDVTTDTVTAWLNSMQSTAGLGPKLWDAYHSETRPTFIPPDSGGLSLTGLGVITLMIFVLFCIFLPKNPPALPGYSERQNGFGKRL